MARDARLAGALTARPNGVERAFLWAFILVVPRQLAMGRTNHLPGLSPDEQRPRTAHLERLLISPAACSLSPAHDTDRVDQESLAPCIVLRATHEQAFKCLSLAELKRHTLGLAR
jgi:hypothetical protein